MLKGLYNHMWLSGCRCIQTCPAAAASARPWRFSTRQILSCKCCLWCTAVSTANGFTANGQCSYGGQEGVGESPPAEHVHFTRSTTV